MQQPEIKKKKGISPIWILPIVALAIGGWLLFKGIQDAGIDIVVHFESGEGVTIGKTQVMYKGIPIGFVNFASFLFNINVNSSLLMVFRYGF